MDASTYLALIAPGMGALDEDQRAELEQEVRDLFQERVRNLRECDCADCTARRAAPQQFLRSKITPHSWERSTAPLTPADCQVDDWQLAETVLGPARLVLLYGPPGTGKTRAAVRAGNPSSVYSVTLTEETPMAELRGHYVPCEDGTLRWQDGPCIAAWRQGARLVLNEIDHAGEDALSFLLALLDDPETAMLTLPNRETVRPSSAFSVVATMNGAPEDLPEALRDRFAVQVRIGTANPQAIEALPEDLRDAAKGASAAPGARRESVRSWQAFAQLREQVGETSAAAAIFGARAYEVLSALRLAADTQHDARARELAPEDEDTYCPDCGGDPCECDAEPAIVCFVCDRELDPGDDYSSGDAGNPAGWEDLTRDYANGDAAGEHWARDCEGDACCASCIAVREIGW